MLINRKDLSRRPQQGEWRISGSNNAATKNA
jgi:hypothetical protein